uniref:Dol-P-Man:Man(5)GlcNAc(2)-PP-Dol alpha-1,3-mannosyltransferase n=1 Tax=Moniliophthora roreri TaxID=221103 RepID=A0A0W0F8T8_MONRR
MAFFRLNSRYPAGHLYIHALLERITNSGSNIAFAQQIYALLYVLSLRLSCAIYEKAGGIPNWVLLLLPLSKRLHSIYVLRLFNDCWSVVAMQCATLAFQSGNDDLGIVLFSAALSIKMSILLYLPAIIIILVKRRGLLYAIRQLFNIASIQGLLALPFVRYNWRTYLRSAFDFERVFLYKWTVNWRMIPEGIFLHPAWAKALLVGHALMLLLFGLGCWCHHDGGAMATISRALRRPNLPAGIPVVTADFIATLLFTCNLIGIMFARSLHYQFYSWHAQQVPFLLWRTKYPLFVKMALMGAIEYSWNIFPSTPFSSSVLLGAHLVLLCGILYGYPCGIPQRKKVPFENTKPASKQM